VTVSFEQAAAILPPPVACAPALVNASANATTIPTGMKPALQLCRISISLVLVIYRQG
jgi:hypothetical protein